MSEDILPTLKAPIIELGKSSGYDVVENYDLGAGPIDIAWIFKPGMPELDPLPDLRIGFVCLLEYSELAVNLAISKSMLNLIDKLILVTLTDKIAKEVRDSIEKGNSSSSIFQLRKYITVLTPSTLVNKSGVLGTKGRHNSNSNITSTEEI